MIRFSSLGSLLILLAFYAPIHHTYSAEEQDDAKDEKKDDEKKEEEVELTGEAAELVKQTQGAWNDEPVDKAIKKGIAYLLSKQNADGSFGVGKYGHIKKCSKIPENSPRAKNPKMLKRIGKLKGAVEESPGLIGMTSVAIYALLKSGVPVHSDPIKKGLKYLMTHDIYGIYTIGLRCNVWVTVENLTGRKGKYMKYLRHDALRLLFSINLEKGGWHYSMWDHKEYHNSPSQYGILGIWGYMMLGGEVPRKFWPIAMKYWIEGQVSDGGWGYDPVFKSANAESVGSMSTAGLASMFVCVDAMLASRYMSCKGGRLPKTIRDGLDWFHREFANTMVGTTKPSKKGTKHFCYYMYGVERVGHACGYKYFGHQDWYKLGALTLIKMQKDNGSWKGDGMNIPETGFALLFLAKGRNTVLFNKLNFGGDWNNRPRDIANLSHWLTIEYEKEFNWQIVNFKVQPHEWHDAPVLYISGAKTPKISDENIKKLRTYVQQGGTILSVTECGGSGFTTGIREIYKKMFPDYELQKIPTSHPLYQIHGKSKRKVPVYILTNGVRPLIIHTDSDMARDWQGRREVTRMHSFEMGFKTSYYVLGQYSDLLPRGKTTWPFAVSTAGLDTVKVVRVKYRGNSNPEPLSLTAFDRRLSAEDGIHIDHSVVDVAKLGACGAKIAFLTGTNKVSLTEAEQAELKAFVKAGGTIVIDAAGGSKDFYKSMYKIVTKTFGAITPLPSSSKIYTVKELTELKSKKPIFRKLARKRIGGNVLKLLGVNEGDRVGVILSLEDIETGFLNSLSGAVDGYSRRTSYELARNIVLNCK